MLQAQSPRPNLQRIGLTQIKDHSRTIADDGPFPVSDICTMTHIDTTPFKAQLLEQRASLLAQLATLRGGAIGRVEASADHFSGREDSSAQTTTERDLELALDDRETTELAAVDAALKRIEAGTYGQCIACEVNIPVARLQAAPEAQRCIHCQEKAEHARAVTSKAGILSG